MGDDPPPVPVTTTTTAPKFSLQILDCIDEVQGLHGVPIGDYSSYRSYCTRRLRRLRSAAPQLLSHASKYATVKSNRRHGYCSRYGNISTTSSTSTSIAADSTLPDPTRHENVMWNYLFLAERAWAHGMSTKRHKGRRFNKAAKWSLLLQQAALVAADEPTQQQATGYACWMQGNAALQRKDYGKAHEHYQECLRCWTTTTGTTTVGQERHSERVESTLQPLIRYCQYEANLDDPITTTTTSGSSSNNHHHTNGGSKKTTTKDTKEEEDAVTNNSKIVVEFRGQRVALDAHQQLALLYLKMQSTLELSTNSGDSDNSSSLDESKIEQLLVDLNDALQIVPPELIVVRDYLEFTKRRFWQALREKSLASSREQPSADWYEALQENAQRMADSTTATTKRDNNDDADADEDDPDRLLATAHAERFRAFKCYYLATTHYEVGSAEQWTLLRHAKTLGKNATEEMVACEDDETDLDAVLDGLEKLNDDIDLHLLRCETTRIIDGGARNSRPLWMRLDEPDGSGPLVDDPPQPLPLAAKGIFFDMAWPYVAASTDGLRPAEPKKSSFLGRWFPSS
jgi:RNA-binding signal recognition particle 68